MNDHVIRMVAEAEGRMHDADLIGQSLRSQSDSQALLKILALEVLLKALQLKSTGTIQQTHKYIELWAKLPAAVRQEVVEAAKTVYPGHANLTNVEKLLCTYEFIFTKARYGYELYADLSLEEQASIGEEWSARGSPTEEADLQYFPMELTALLDSLLKAVRSAAS